MNTQNPYTAGTDRLIPEFVAFVKALPFEFRGDAEELRNDKRLDDAGRSWVRDFVERWERAEARSEVVAKIAIGAEAIDDGLGCLILSGNVDAGFEVFVNGGTLPNGREYVGFFGPLAAAQALEFFLATARELAVEMIDIGNDADASEIGGQS